jgi:Thymidylate kinase
MIQRGGRRGDPSREWPRVIAVVGSEATGKSTILGEAEKWLAQSNRVRRIHAGKPPSTLLTFIPHSLLPALRRVFPEQRSLEVGARYEDGRETEKAFPLLFGVRSVMLAYERRALIRDAFAWANAGAFVLSDRYPSWGSGSPDGPQLLYRPVGSGRALVRRWLVALETRLYRDIPEPDVVLHLAAPVEVTLARNAAREKREPEDYVRFRHSLASNLRFDGTIVHRVDTDRPLEDVVQEVKEVIGG